MIIALLNAAGITADQHDRIQKVFQTENIGQGLYTEEVFKAHVEAIKEKGEGYVAWMETTATTPALAPMYGFLLQSGPNAVYAMLASMGNAGLLDKKLVSSSAKLPAKVKSERPWFNSIWDELGAVSYAAASKHFEANLADFRSKYPEIPDEVKTLHGMLVECKKSTLYASIDGASIPVTQRPDKDGNVKTKDCAVAIGFRLDAHSAARNGGYDPETGEWTEKAAKEEAATAK